MPRDFVMETEKMDQDISAHVEVTSTTTETEETNDEGIFLETKEEVTAKFSFKSLLDDLKVQILIEPGQFNSRLHGEENSRQDHNYDSLSQIALPSAPEEKYQKNNIKLMQIQCSHCGNRFQRLVQNSSTKSKKKKESRRFRKKLRGITKLLEKL